MNTNLWDPCLCRVRDTLPRKKVEFLNAFRRIGLAISFAAYVASFWMPSVNAGAFAGHGSQDYPGYIAFGGAVWLSFYVKNAKNIWQALPIFSWLANVLFPVVIASRRRWAGRRRRSFVIGAAAITLAWLPCFPYTNYLRIGYFVWATSISLGIALALALRVQPFTADDRSS